MRGGVWVMRGGVRVMRGGVRVQVRAWLSVRMRLRMRCRLYGAVPQMGGVRATW